MLPKLIALFCVVLILAREWSTGELPRAFRAFLLADKRPMLAALAFLSLFAALFSLADTVVLNAVRSTTLPVAPALFSFGGTLGRHMHPWLAAGLCYLAGVLGKRGSLQDAGRGMIFSAALASTLAYALKFILLRARPYADLGPFSFFNGAGLFQDDRAFQSFPSGDVAVVSGMSFYLFCTAAPNPLRWALVLLPLATAFSRVSLNKHWPSDTLFALGLGAVMAMAVWRSLKTRGECR